eukprot:GHRQ01008090.1.p2 GENE.GHRQ01008090.1~~GHRQ01008090.1.p2  ORF type:complete len:191 (-),score=31.20 GHRQ01008090.1:1327-1899(-)
MHQHQAARPHALASRQNALLFVWRSQEIDELHKIFMKLGTPDESVWPGVRNLPDYKDTFPRWWPQPLQVRCCCFHWLLHAWQPPFSQLLGRKLLPHAISAASIHNLPHCAHGGMYRCVCLQDTCPNLRDPLGLDLLGRMLVYDPQMRITARQALQHQYFHDITDMVGCLLPSVLVNQKACAPEGIMVHRA